MSVLGESISVEKLLAVPLGADAFTPFILLSIRGATNDTVIASESVSFELNRAFSDNVTATESILISLGYLVEDSTTITDNGITLVFIKDLTETATASESLVFSTLTNFVDSVLASEVIDVVLVKLETLAAETVNIIENLLGFTVQKQVQDQVNAEMSGSISLNSYFSEDYITDDYIGEVTNI